MMNYKPATFSLGKRERPIRTIKLQIEEKPTRPEYELLSSKQRFRYITMIKAETRKTVEYRQYIEFLKKHRGMHTSIVLPAATRANGKKYSIELHHEPFSMFEIIDIIVSKREAQGESLKPFDVIEEVLELHYDEKVGLVPLDITSHELCEKGKIFIPLQHIYQRYDQFYDEYSELCTIPEKIEQSLEIKVTLSEKFAADLNNEGKLVLSDLLEPQFTYLEFNGQLFPELPPEWGEALSINNQEIFLKGNSQ